MKHFVAISLVFFSLTQLARVERAEAFRLMTEGYSQQEVTLQNYEENLNVAQQVLKTRFLSADALALVGMRPVSQGHAYALCDQHVSDLFVIREPNNNSPPRV